MFHRAASVQKHLEQGAEPEISAEKKQDINNTFFRVRKGGSVSSNYDIGMTITLALVWQVNESCLIPSKDMMT